MKMLWKYLTLSFISLLLILPSSGQSGEPVWSDEFGYEGLPDSTKWSYETGGGGWGNNELEYYTGKDTDNAVVHNGKLAITARMESLGGRSYTSARMVTKQKGDWLYGRIEIRAKLPSGRGTWPAIWMMPTDAFYGGWPNSGEIDIMEHVGYDPGVVHATIHTDYYNGAEGTQKGLSITVPDAMDTFHIYAVEWTPQELSFYMDQTHYFSYFYTSDYKAWPFNKRFFLIMNIAVGGNWGGIQGVDNTAFPTRMEIDYVRVYQMASALKEAPDEQLAVYPVPVNSTLHLDHISGIKNIRVSELSGIQLFSKDLNSFTGNEYDLDFSRYPDGMYILSVTDADNSITVRKISLIR